MTGSGVTLGALVRHASAAGWDQGAVVGTSSDDPRPPVGGLPGERIHPLVFDSDALPFPLPGMSDVMPYPSSRFSAMTTRQIEAYRASWRTHLERVVRAEAPDLVHVHHVWIVAALMKDVAPGLPVVTHCHATGLRQRALCPHLAERVRHGVRRNDLFLVLHGNDAKRLETEIGVPRGRSRIVGAGYRRDLFHEDGRPFAADAGGEILFVGKFARAKGLPWLLDAVERLADRRPVRLHLAGGGSGEEAAAIERRLRDMADLVVVHGRAERLAILPVPLDSPIGRSVHESRMGQVAHRVQRHPLPPPAALFALLAPRVVDQHRPHDLAREPVELAAAVELEATMTRDPHPGLVDDRRRLQRVVRRLSAHV